MNTKWVKWDNIASIPNIKQPGIYFLTHTKTNIDGQDFKMLQEIIYIGMTISKKGVKGRLYQFERAMKGINGVHGGAERVRFKHKKHKSLLGNLYVSIRLFPVSEEQNDPKDWRQKGECVKHEYVSFADYINKYNQLPEFNDQQKSPKK